MAQIFSTPQVVSASAAAPAITSVAAPVAAPAANTDNKLPTDLINTMQQLFGKHKGYRTTHAKGLLVEGKFTPTDQAKTLSTAAHFNNASTPVIARFSVGGGLPNVRDVDGRATPKGIAIRFQVNQDTSSDMIAHSFNGFATRTGEDFLEFLKLVGMAQFTGAQFATAKTSDSDYKSKQDAATKAGGALQAFAQRVPTAGVFLNGEKPNPYNYGTITYYQPNTHVLTNSAGKVTNVRYRLVPADGDHLYSAAEIGALAPNYLEDDLSQRFPSKPIVFTIQAHIAGPNDVLDDATILYKSTTFVPIGKLELNKVSDDNLNKQQQIAFSPIPSRGGITGIESSNDPLIQTRKGVYYISSEQRRNEQREVVATS